MFFKQHIRWIVPLMGVLFFGSIIALVAKEPASFEPTEHYEVQLADELYYTDETIQAWIDSVRDEKGVHKKTIKNFKYLLICAGSQSNDQAALALVDTVQTQKEMQVVYAFIEGDAANVSEEESKPFMLVRIPANSSLKLVAKQISEDKIPAYLEEKRNQNQ